MSTSYKAKVSITFAIVIIFFSFLTIKENYANAQEAKESIYSTHNSEFKLNFSYPDNWKVQEREGGTSTPFAVLLSDTDLENYHQGYPDRFVNIVFYKTNQTEDEYANADLNAKRVENKKEYNTQIEGKNVKKYKSSFKQGEYLSAYTRKGDFLIIVESYIKNTSDENKTEEIFDQILSTIKTN